MAVYLYMSANGELADSICHCEPVRTLAWQSPGFSEHQRQKAPSPLHAWRGEGTQNVSADTIQPGGCHTSVRAGSQRQSVSYKSLLTNSLIHKRTGAAQNQAAPAFSFFRSSNSRCRSAGPPCGHISPFARTWPGGFPALPPRRRTGPRFCLPRPRCAFCGQ